MPVTPLLLIALASAADSVTATVTITKAPESMGHCGTLHLVSLAQVAPIDGLSEGPLWVAISCPELHPPLPVGAVACMTLSPDDPGWPRPHPVPPEGAGWLHALKITAGACGEGVSR